MSSEQVRETSDMKASEKTIKRCFDIYFCFCFLFFCLTSEAVEIKCFQDKKISCSLVKKEF